MFGFGGSVKIYYCPTPVNMRKLENKKMVHDSPYEGLVSVSSRKSRGGTVCPEPVRNARSEKFTVTVTPFAKRVRWTSFSASSQSNAVIFS